MESFCLFIRGNNFANTEPSPAQMQEHLMNWLSWTDLLKQEYAFEKSYPLTTNYKENTTTISGVLLIKAQNMDKAIEADKGCPALAFGDTIEVRQIKKF